MWNWVDNYLLYMAMSLLIWWRPDPVFGPTESLLNLSSMRDTDASCLFILLLRKIPLCLTSLRVKALHFNTMLITQRPAVMGADRANLNL